MGHSYGMMEINMKENSNLIAYKVLGTMFGLMVESMKDLGKTKKCMGEEYLLGQMEEGMKGNM